MRSKSISPLLVRLELGLDSPGNVDTDPPSDSVVAGLSRGHPLELACIDHWLPLNPDALLEAKFGELVELSP